MRVVEEARRSHRPSTDRVGTSVNKPCTREYPTGTVPARFPTPWPGRVPGARRSARHCRIGLVGDLARRIANTARRSKPSPRTGGPWPRCRPRTVSDDQKRADDSGCRPAPSGGTPHGRSTLAAACRARSPPSRSTSSRSDKPERLQHHHRVQHPCRDRRTTEPRAH